MVTKITTENTIRLSLSIVGQEEARALADVIPNDIDKVCHAVARFMPPLTL